MDNQILQLIQGYKIPFFAPPEQRKVLSCVNIPRDQIHLMDQEILNMLEKGAIKSVFPVKNQFLSSLFLVGKKDGGHRPVINLKHLNSFIPYEHFKMEGLFLLKEMLKHEDYMCKLDLKDAYFSV